jgi:glutaredoxin
MKAILWSKYYCPNCERARSLMENHGICIEERKIGDGWTREDLLEQVPAAKSVPQIFIDGTYIGGVKELENHILKDTA